jgi:hypothetical protein
LAKPFSTVCSDPFYGQTSSPRRLKFSQADSKLDVEVGRKNITEKNSEFYYFFSMKTRSVAKHSASLNNNLSKPFSTICSDPFYRQTSGPRTPKLSQADFKFDMEFRNTKKS